MILVSIFLTLFCTFHLVFTSRFHNLPMKQIDLNTYDWSFRCRNCSLMGKATIPGDIYMDLFRERLIPEPLYGNNDQQLRWVTENDWIYETTFRLDRIWKEYKAVVLSIEGLDTISIVYLNGAEVLRTHNQFLSYLIPLEVWRVGDNNLTIEFKSPIRYSKKRADDYHARVLHEVPPVCPPEVFHGVCHANFIRKIQASFSWDWGPAFPTVGIWQPMKLYGVNTIVFERISATIKAEQDSFIITVEMHIFSAVSSDSLEGLVTIPELALWASFKERVIGMRRNRFTVSLIVHTESVELWWPNGYGKQRLYVLKANAKLNGEDIHAIPIKIGFRRIELQQNLVDSNNPTKGRNFFFKLNNIPIFLKGEDIHAIPIKIGFRRIELQQNLVDSNNPTKGRNFFFKLNNIPIFLKGEDIHAIPIKIGFRRIELQQNLVDSNNPTKGRNFFFKLNNIPIFLKGSNWIPISPFPAQNHTKRMRFLLKSTVDANMNALRVWGGGRYESDEFYEMADEMGILIWHDLMFACALYPVDEIFLSSVRKEITQQIRRLRHHASILIWAGNNENELAIRASWWYVNNYPIDAMIHRLRHHASILIWAGNNENELAIRASWWYVNNYPIDAMVKDYVKLYRETIAPIVSELDDSRPFIVSSPSNGIDAEREGGVAINPNDPKYGDIHFYNEMVDLWKDNVYQIPRCATEYGVQSLPRKWRGIINKDGEGNTMCALYWQLNDVWAAPTWSTIDFDLSWKPAHYFARRFFDKTIISMVNFY
uniref:beta-mannosidase n=1 Tax=Ascaris lumbricoides TaxID=6252 RepID=A0A0M3IL90_ASCLU